MSLGLETQYTRRETFPRHKKENLPQRHRSKRVFCHKGRDIEMSLGLETQDTRRETFPEDTRRKTFPRDTEVLLNQGDTAAMSPSGHHYIYGH